MFRKCVAAFAALVICVGAIFAEEIKGVFVKFEDGKVTVKVDDKDKTYEVDKDAVVKFKDKEFPLTKAMERWKEGDKVILEVEKDKVVKGKREGKKKKD
jgi:hypothetical protein